LELFAWVNSLEKWLSALPCQVSDMIDKKMDKWRSYMRDDIRSTIHEIDEERRKQ